MKIKKTFCWEYAFAAMTIGMLLFYVIRLLIPMRWQDLYNAYGIIAIGIMTGAWFAKRGFSGPVELKIYAAFVVWAFLSRWLKGDVYLFIDFSLVITVLLGFLFIAYPTVLDEKGCSVFMDFVTVIYVGLFLPVAIASIFVFLTDTYIHLPPENVWITIKNEGQRLTLNALSVYRLTAVAYFFLSACLLIYQLIKRKSKVIRGLCLAAYIPLHVVIGLCHSRTLHIAMSVSFAMLMMLAFIPVFEKRTKPLRFAAVSIIAAASLLVFYKSFDASNLAVEKIRAVSAPAYETYYNTLEAKPNEEYFGLRSETQNETEISGPEQSSTVDNRSLVGNWTLTERTYIWKAGLIAISEDMETALLGSNSKELMPKINQLISSRVNPAVTERKTHMHNAYIQVLMLFGIPGLLLLMAWTVFMVKKMVKLFFSKKASFADKFLTIPLAGIFIASLTETFIFTTNNTISIIFYLFAGIFLARYYQIMKN